VSSGEQEVGSTGADALESGVPEGEAADGAAPEAPPPPPPPPPPAAGDPTPEVPRERRPTTRSFFFAAGEPSSELERPTPAPSAEAIHTPQDTEVEPLEVPGEAGDGTQRLREELGQQAESIDRTGRHATYRLRWSKLVASMTRILEDLGLDREVAQRATREVLRRAGKSAEDVEPTAPPGDEGETEGLRQRLARLEGELERALQVPTLTDEDDVRELEEKVTGLEAELERARREARRLEDELAAHRERSERELDEAWRERDEAARARDDAVAAREDAEAAAAEARGARDDALAENRGERDRAARVREAAEARVAEAHEDLQRSRVGYERELERLRHDRGRLEETLGEVFRRVPREGADAPWDEREPTTEEAVANLRGVLERLGRSERELRTAVLLPEPPFGELRRRLESARDAPRLRRARRERLERLAGEVDRLEARYERLDERFGGGRPTVEDLVALARVVERALGVERLLEG